MNYTIPDKMKDWQKKSPLAISFFAVIALLLLWEALCRFGGISPLFLPSPLKILAALKAMLLSGELAECLWASMKRILAGFLIGTTIGILTGLTTGISSLADRAGSPFVNALYPIPKIALLPLFILWLGIGELSKITIIALGVFFPVAINTYSGVKNVDPLLLKVAVSFDAGRGLILRSLIIPHALPMIFTGLRLAAGTALLLLTAAEMIAADKGIGALILHYGDLMITDRLMAGLAVLSILGVLLQASLQKIEKRFSYRK